MTTTFKWAAGEGAQSALTTEMNSLLNGGAAISAAIDNLTDLYEYLDVEVYLASYTTGATPFLNLYVIYSVDGTNYEDSTALAKRPDAIIPLPASNTGVLRRVEVNIPVAPLKFKLLLVNVSGATLASSGNTLKYNRHNEQAV